MKLEDLKPGTIVSILPSHLDAFRGPARVVEVGSARGWRGTVLVDDGAHRCAWLVASRISGVTK